MNFEQVPEFQKDLKKLQKKWRSLPSDIKYTEPRIEALYTGDSEQELAEFRAAFFNGKRATILQALDDGREVIKMRLDVESLASNDKVRVIFIAVRLDKTIRLVELYAKNEKSREDWGRIKKYL